VRYSGVRKSIMLSILIAKSFKGLNLLAILRTVAVAGLVLFLPSSAISNSLPALAGLSATVDAGAGSYTISSADPQWVFTGSVGAPMDHLSHRSGRDEIGQYSETSFQWIDVRPFTGTIRTYNGKSLARFFIRSNETLSGPTPDFPSFTTFPSGLQSISYRDSNFSPHTFALERTSTPWILFDDQANTAVLSPASDFMVSQMHGSLSTTLSSGIEPGIALLPAGFAHQTILAVGTGIESTIHRWGDAVTALSSKARPIDDNDMMLKYLGYWTDHGAYYYYNYDHDKGYAGTLLAVMAEYKREKIPLHYFQLDSWWYQKTRTDFNGHVGGPVNSTLPVGTWNAYGGTVDYSASPALFPFGLQKFDEDLGVPLAVHARWIDPASPYHAEYKISGVAPVDPLYWDDRAKYLSQNGVFCYEQDWLIDIYKYSPQMATDLDTGNAFTDNMARATSANGETMQYCMPTPRFFLQGSKYSNLTTIRTSDDYFIRPRWNDFLYTSILADALHIRPWTDVLMSTDLGGIILATLSSGPVGIGDKMETESIPNIRETIRGDGVIIKPDAPLLPTDSSISNDSVNAHLPLIASTYTDNGQKTVYVFVFARPGDSSSVSFKPASFGLYGPVYVTSPSGGAKEQETSDEFTDKLDSTGWAFYTIAPVGRSGIAFFGDSGKFIGTGRQRIQSVVDKPGQLTAEVILTPEESSATLAGYCAIAPTVKLSAGVAGPVQFDPQSHYFSVTIPNPAGATTDPIETSTVERVDVVFTTKLPENFIMREGISKGGGMEKL
jgi:hypothetical protein